VTNTTSPTERVGRYQLLDPIGVGPSGVVSRAKVFGVAGFERQFAVKRFHAELTATAAMAAMMSAAARAYGSLEHPRIARMSEFGVAQGSTFTAVEFVVGLDALKLIGEARLAGVTLAAGGALALVSQAARAVGYAHGRGLTHLGLAPTNVIVTADGDIKITDFGLLSATLPQRPIEVPRLAQRIPYLAPEQLANEATSAATDVFALGVLAYELVTSSRTFKGDTPQQVASAIMAGPPAEPPLPRPIVRVLQRCLARSPFERFPDARALADALDAALRVAPVPGTRKDVGAQVKETLDRLAALNEGQMSGVVALHLGTGPIRRLGEDARAPSQGEPDPETVRQTSEALAYELSRPDPPAGGPLAFGGPATTQPDLPRSPITTVPGMAPPPIPVPQGVGGPPTVPLAAPPGASTLLGVGKSPPALPSRSHSVNAIAIASRMHAANISAATTSRGEVFLRALLQVAPQPNAPLIVLFRGSLAVIVTRKRGPALAPWNRKGSDEAAN
jgi:serine/threonine-protein kinase